MPINMAKSKQGPVTGRLYSTRGGSVQSGASTAQLRLTILSRTWQRATFARICQQHQHNRHTFVRSIKTDRQNTCVVHNVDNAARRRPLYDVVVRGGRGGGRGTGRSSRCVINILRFTPSAADVPTSPTVKLKLKRFPTSQWYVREPCASSSPKHRTYIVKQTRQLTSLGALT